MHFLPLPRLINKLRENSWPAQLLPALRIASAVTGCSTSDFCSGSLSERQNSSRVLSTRLVSTPLHCTAPPPTASAVSVVFSWQPQDSELARVNSFCICQSLRMSGQAENLNPLHCLSIPSFLEQTCIKHSLPQDTILGSRQYAIYQVSSEGNGYAPLSLSRCLYSLQ